VPIDIDEFQTASEEELREDGSPIQEAVIEYLSYNPDLAYSRAELQSALDTEAIHLLHALSALERKGIVRQKGGYWAINEGHERVETED